MTIGNRPTVGAALTGAIDRLRAAGSPTPRLDAEVLIAHVIGCDRSWLLAHPEAPLGRQTELEGVLERRAAGEPIAYIRGFKEWHSLRLRTDARSLIPRPETELLADAAIAEIAERLERRAGRDPNPVVAREVATGSGAVAVLLALRFRAAIGARSFVLAATDASADALALAAENLAEHGAGGLVMVGRAGLLDPAGEALPRPDVVVANLPYVPSAEVDADEGSLGYEPRIALDGGPDGLALVRNLLGELPDRAAPGATALLEIGVGQAEAVRQLAPNGASITIVPDLAGLDRIVRVEMPN